jgi:hypothetical protein
MIGKTADGWRGWRRRVLALGLLAAIGCDAGDDGSRRVPTPTLTATATAAVTVPPSATASATATATTVPSSTATPTVTVTPTATLSASATPTGTPTVIAVSTVNAAPTSAPAGRELPDRMTVRVTDGSGAGRPGIEVEFAVIAGGGTVEPQRITTAADGTASAAWTLGVVPVQNRLRARAVGQTVRFTTRATIDEPYAASPFGNVHDFMTEQGLAGSTEDLAFEGGRFVLGIPGGLLQVDPQGVTSQIPLTGDPLVSALGVAFDQSGNLWVADSMGHALRKVSPEGVVTTEVTDDGTNPLRSPNYVAIDVKGRVYLSDPCLGELLRYDPATDAVDAVLRFDLPGEGGPNGFAFDETGEKLYIATENTLLFCGSEGVGLTDELAGLFVAGVSDEGFGERTAIATRVAIFGDGVALDREGNVYVIFDTQANLMLQESAVWVLPSGEEQIVKFLSATDRVFANLAFGRGDFGNTNLYISLLTIPSLIPPESRGLNRFDTGIRGLRVPPLPPEEESRAD